MQKIFPQDEEVVGSDSAGCWIVSYYLSFSIAIALSSVSLWRCNITDFHIALLSFVAGVNQAECAQESAK